MLFRKESKRRVKRTIKTYPKAGNIEKIKNEFSKKEWKVLEKKLNSTTYLKVIGIGYIILFSSLFIGMFVSEGYFIFLMPGLFLAKTPLYFHFKKKKVQKFVENIVNYENATGDVVMPPLFQIKNHREIPYRRKPEISEKKLKKLIKAEKRRKGGTMIIGVFLLIIVYTILPLLLIPLGVSLLITILAFLSVHVPFFAYMAVMAARTNKLASIKKYEEMSGEKVISDELKSKLS